MRRTLWLLVASAALFDRAVYPQSPWSAALNVGYATGVDNSDFTHGSFGLTGDIFRQVGRTLGVGAEAGYHRYESRSEVVIGIGTTENRRSAWHLAGTVRVRRPDGRVRPYGLAGVGLYGLRENGDDFVAPGLNAGGGLEFHPGGGPFGIGVSTRFHLAGRPSDGGIGGAGFLTLMAVLAYR
jgi:outer membrane protein with beta-barrel domain